MQMEVGTNRLDNLHNYNMSNGRVGGRGKAPHRHHSKIVSPPASGNEFHSPNRPSHSDHEKNAKKEETAEIREQTTKKILNAFFKSIVDKNGVAERIRRESRERFEKETTQSEDRRNAATGNRTTGPTRVPLRKESNDEKLYKVMSGQLRSTPRHQSDISVASSDSADSGLTKGRFQRTKSFSKAQRHSIVTELENRDNKATTISRRSSESIPQTSSLYLEGSLPEASTTTNDEKASSPSAHTRASSDPVMAHYDTTGRYKPQTKEKMRKSWFKSKLFKKKKDGHKSKEDSKDSVTSAEAVVTKHQNNKVAKAHSSRRTVSREDSTASRRRSPSPPSSPRKILRKFSFKKKGGKGDSSSKSTNRSKSLEWDIDEDEEAFGPRNGDSKSNSLPIEARLSTKPNSHPKKHSHQELRSQVGVAYSEGSSDTGKKSEKSDPLDIERPSTLELQKKKEKHSSAFKKFKKILFDSSSSSSSPSSSEEDLTKALEDELEPGTTDKAHIGRSVQHSNSDTPPTVNDTRDRYQHRPSKSMNDMDPMDKHCSEIAQKLRRVAEHYGHIYSQHYVGPTGRTQTPDSYRQDTQKIAGHGKTPGSGARRSASHTACRAPSSHSMKAYYNMEAGRQRNTNENVERRQHRRITRDEIDHRPSGSFDSPHRQESSTRWSDRVHTERTPRTVTRVAHFKGHGYSSPSHPTPSPSLPQHHRRHPAPNMHPHSTRSTPLPPPPVMSTSPPLQSYRRSHPATASADVTDSHPSKHHMYHIESHRDRTVTSSTSGHVRRTVHTHTDVVEEIEADSLPIVSLDTVSADSPDDFGAGFADGDVTEVTETEEITVTEELDNYAATEGAHRPRAATTPDMPTPVSDEEELGAIGGVEPIDTEKLVAKLVEALCNRGDKYNNTLGVDTPEIEEVLIKKLSGITKEKAKHILERVMSKINETTVTFRHPEIVQLALIFNMAEIVRRVTTQPSVFTSLLNSFIDPIVKGIGGWSMVKCSLDETEEELSSLDVEGPSTSGLNTHRENKPEKPRDRSDDTDDELD